MINRNYNLKWRETIDDLKEQLELESFPGEQQDQTAGGVKYITEIILKKKTQKQDQEWFHYYATLYIKYIEIYKKLEDCFDQMVHP